MMQFALDGTFSLGIHVDPKTRVAEAGAYGPYVDLHVGPVVASLGYHPARASGIVELYGIDAIMRPDRG